MKVAIEDLLKDVEEGQEIIISFNGFRVPYEGYVIGRKGGRIILSDKLSDKYHIKKGEEVKTKRTFSEISVQDFSPYSGFKGPDWRFRDIQGGLLTP